MWNSFKVKLRYIGIVNPGKRVILRWKVMLMSLLTILRLNAV
jgi:hypothetical protein